MIIKKKLRQHAKKFDPVHASHNPTIASAIARSAIPPRPITLAPVGGLTLVEIEEKYGPIKAIKRRARHNV
jgi:hypothetical protein